VEEFKDRQIRFSPIDVSGLIADHFQPQPLELRNLVGPRPGIVYRTHADSDSTRLNFGGRTITFPEFFSVPLGFALKTPVFAIGDLPGDVEDQERIVLVQRLMQEGLIVRKGK